MQNSEAVPKNFVQQQLTYGRVSDADERHHEALEAALNLVNLSLDNIEISLVVFKDPGKLEVYGRKVGEGVFQKLGQFRMTARSGKLGPKNQEGDRQIPEGHYEITRFNPKSSFLLSLGINYPNEADKKRSKAKKLGGDIFIHGSHYSIGCIAIGDNAIEQLYLLAIHAYQNTNHFIPVTIYPFKMTDNRFRKAEYDFANQEEVIDFWKTLKPDYDTFLKTHNCTNLSLLPLYQKEESVKEIKEVFMDISNYIDSKLE